MDTVYPRLPELWSELSLKKGASILVPFCGKTLDMNWLVQKGYHVIGIDAIKKGLLEWMGAYPKSFSKESYRDYTVYRSEHIELWHGNFFSLTPCDIGAVDVVYDKAAMIALPKEKRPAYAKKVLDLCDEHTQIILQTFEYKQDEMSGPPFSIPEKEVQSFYGDQFKVKLLHEQSKLDELNKFQQRGLSTYLTEKVYHLIPLNKK